MKHLQLIVLDAMEVARVQAGQPVQIAVDGYADPVLLTGEPTIPLVCKPQTKSGARNAPLRAKLLEALKGETKPVVVRELLGRLEVNVSNGYTVLKKHPEFQVTGKRGHRMVRLRKGA